MSSNRVTVAPPTCLFKAHPSIQSPSMHARGKLYLGCQLRLDDVAELGRHSRHTSRAASYIISCVNALNFDFDFGAVRTLGGAAYSPRAAPKAPTKGHTTGTRARAPTRSCTCAKALTETHRSRRPGLAVSDSNLLCIQSKLGTPSRPLFLCSPENAFDSLPGCVCFCWPR
jgi:hypothetical protein